jgi:hypothetical protein
MSEMGHNLPFPRLSPSTLPSTAQDKNIYVNNFLDESMRPKFGPEHAADTGQKFRARKIMSSGGGGGGELRQRGQVQVSSGRADEGASSGWVQVDEGKEAPASGAGDPPPPQQQPPPRHLPAMAGRPMMRRAVVPNSDDMKVLLSAFYLKIDPGMRGLPNKTRRRRLLSLLPSPSLSLPPSSLLFSSPFPNSFSRHSRILNSELSTCIYISACPLVFPSACLIFTPAPLQQHSVLVINPS